MSLLYRLVSLQPGPDLEAGAGSEFALCVPRGCSGAPTAVYSYTIASATTGVSVYRRFRFKNNILINQNDKMIDRKGKNGLIGAYFYSIKAEKQQGSRNACVL